jgi:hypothetical protein
MSSSKASRKRPRDSAAATDSDRTESQSTEATDAGHSLARSALASRVNEDSTPKYWTQVAYFAGTVGRDAFLCHLGRSVAAAMRTTAEAAETARTRLRAERVALHAAIDTRFDALETRLTMAENAKLVALEGQLNAVDCDLECWQRESRSVREATTTLVDSELAQQQTVFAARLDGVEAQLRALATAVVEPPFLSIVSCLPALLEQIASYGAMAAPLAVTAADLTLTGLPPYALRGGPLRFQLALGDRHAGQSPEELETSLGHAVRSLRVEASLFVDGLSSQPLPAQVSSFPLSRRIDVSHPLSEGLTGGAVSVSTIVCSGHHISITPLLRVLLVRGLAPSKLAAIKSDDPGCVIAAMQTSMSQADVVAQGCASLNVISKTSGGVLASIEAGAPIALVSAIHAFASHANIAEFASAALKNVANIDAGKEAAVGAGAPAALVAAMRAHLGDVNVLRQLRLPLDLLQKSTQESKLLLTLVHPLHLSPPCVPILQMNTSLEQLHLPLET